MRATTQNEHNQHNQNQSATRQNNQMRTKRQQEPTNQSGHMRTQQSVRRRQHIQDERKRARHKCTHTQRERKGAPPDTNAHTNGKAESTLRAQETARADNSTISIITQNQSARRQQHTYGRHEEGQSGACAIREEACTTRHKCTHTHAHKWERREHI